MKFAVDLNTRPTMLVLTVSTTQPIKLAFIGYDASKKNTYYFARELTINGKKTIQFPMPQAPGVLTIDVMNRYNDYGNVINILDAKALPLPSKMVAFPKGMDSYVKFAQSFAEKAGHINAGFYVSKDENHIIWMKPVIEDGSPAKVNRRTGLVKVDINKFKKYTVPMRMFVLLHEFWHFWGKTKNEFEADRGALNMYMQLQYPKSEGNYAMTKVFTDTPMARRRAEQMHKIFKNSK